MSCWWQCERFSFFLSLSHLLFLSSSLSHKSTHTPSPSLSLSLSLDPPPPPPDWSVLCLLTLKHLVSLQARTGPSVQAELDLHATADRWWEERYYKKRNFCICSLKRLPYKRLLPIGFFFPGFPKVVCAYIHYRSVSGCVYSTIFPYI
jgi:hypothetical protein